MQLKIFVAAVCYALTPSLARADGRIVVAHDEWTLSNQGFSFAPSAAQFARNVADWFTGGQAGTFRVWSNNFGLTGTSLGNAMTGAGHSWTVSTAGTFDLATLQQYDAVFLGVYVSGIDAAVLSAYVQGGGNVYLCAGGGAAATASTAFNPFLANFGLSYANTYNNLNGTRAIASAHPIFAGVASLYEATGNSITDLTPADPSSAILITGSAQGLYAVYDGGVIASTYCTAKTNSLGCVPAIGSSGFPSASSASPFNITASAVLNQKQGLFFYGYAQAISPFQGGFKCMANPTARTPVQSSGGNALPASDCSGLYMLDFNAHIQSGVDPLLVVNQEVNGQFWSRDPASPSTTGLTDAIHFVIGS